MKKTLIILLCLAYSGFGGQDKPKETVIKLSAVEWKAVKECVDTNGYCRIAWQNAAIVITNGLPNVEVIHHFPFGRGPAKIERQKDKDTIEPVPYAGQGGW